MPLTTHTEGGSCTHSALQACRTLATLARDAGPARCVAMQGVLQGLKRVLQRYHERPEVLEEACYAISSLAPHVPNRGIMMQGYLPLLQNMIRQYPASTEIRHAAVRAVLSIVAGDQPNVTATQPGLLGLLHLIMDQHCETPDMIQVWVWVCVWRGRLVHLKVRSKGEICVGGISCLPQL